MISGSGGTAQVLLDDTLWSQMPSLMPLPADEATVCAFASPTGSEQDEEVFEFMAKGLHDRYLAVNQSEYPPKLQSWDKLPETFRLANIEQARHSIRILQTAGFEVRSVEDEPVIFSDFRPEEIEQMAELEHGRWNVERLRDGWRHGIRDNAEKRHDCLVPWSKLPEAIKDFDRTAVCEFPRILAAAKLEVFRNSGSAR